MRGGYGEEAKDELLNIWLRSTTFLTLVRYNNGLILKENISSPCEILEVSRKVGAIQVFLPWPPQFKENSP